jgi:hypothetical protein
MSVSGVQSEAQLPFAGLYQLVRPRLDRLDAPRRRNATL